MAVIALVTLIDVRGVRIGGRLMTCFTAAKVAALVGLIIAVVFSGKGQAANWLPLWPENWSRELTAGFRLPMISVLWAYDGWTIVTLTAGEIRNPERNVPLSLVAGTLAVIAL